MDKKNEKAVKNIFSQARRSYCMGMGRGMVWCGYDLRRLLNRIFLRPGRIWCKAKSKGLKRGPCLVFLPTSFCGKNDLVA
jgi:hypothetical protein